MTQEIVYQFTNLKFTIVTIFCLLWIFYLSLTDMLHTYSNVHFLQQVCRCNVPVFSYIIVVIWFWHNSCLAFCAMSNLQKLSLFTHHRGILFGSVQPAMLGQTKTIFLNAILMSIEKKRSLKIIYGRQNIGLAKNLKIVS